MKILDVYSKNNIERNIYKTEKSPCVPFGAAIVTIVWNKVIQQFLDGVADNTTIKCDQGRLLVNFRQDIVK